MYRLTEFFKRRMVSSDVLSLKNKASPRLWSLLILEVLFDHFFNQVQHLSSQDWLSSEIIL